MTQLDALHFDSYSKFRTVRVRMRHAAGQNTVGHFKLNKVAFRQWKGLYQTETGLRDIVCAAQP